LRNVKVIAVELELFSTRAQGGARQRPVQQRADKHVASDSADQVEVECFHILL